MKVENVLWAWGIASIFVFWPILGRYSGATGGWVNTIVLIGSAIGGIGFALSSIIRCPIPSAFAFACLLAAGIINGIAVYFYSIKIADPKVPTGAFIMTVIVLMVVMVPVFDFLLNGVNLSIKQWLGLVTAILAVFLLAG